MTARPPSALLALALFVAASNVSVAQDAAANDPDWAPLDPKTMPGVFYDGASIRTVSQNPAVMSVTVGWFYAQPKISEVNGKPYGSVTQTVKIDCSADTYTVTELVHHAGNNATGAIVESIPVAGIRNAPVTRDPVQRQLRDLICAANRKRARK